MKMQFFLEETQTTAAKIQQDKFTARLEQLLLEFGQTGIDLEEGGQVRVVATQRTDQKVTMLGVQFLRMGPFQIGGCILSTVAVPA